MTVRNVVFDIGNVLVRWDPLAIVEAALGVSGEEAKAHHHALFVEADIWRALNRGEFTEAEAMRAFVDAGHLSNEEAERLFALVYQSLHLLADTPPLMERLVAAGYRLFALTDNVREIVAHLQAEHDWWGLFEGATVSAAVGCLKPDPRIYRRLLDDHDLVAAETVFFDDMPCNVEGARAVGMHAFLFTDAASAERDLEALGVVLGAR